MRKKKCAILLFCVVLLYSGILVSFERNKRDVTLKCNWHWPCSYCTGRMCRFVVLEDGVVFCASDVFPAEGPIKEIIYPWNSTFCLGPTTTTFKPTTSKTTSTSATTTAFVPTPPTTFPPLTTTAHPEEGTSGWLIALYSLLGILGTACLILAVIIAAFRKYCSCLFSENQVDRIEAPLEEDLQAADEQVEGPARGRILQNEDNAQENEEMELVSLHAVVNEPALPPEADVMPPPEVPLDFFQNVRVRLNDAITAQDSRQEQEEDVPVRRQSVRIREKREREQQTAEDRV